MGGGPLIGTLVGFVFFSLKEDAVLGCIASEDELPLAANCHGR